MSYFDDGMNWIKIASVLQVLVVILWFISRYINISTVWLPYWLFMLVISIIGLISSVNAKKKGFENYKWNLVLGLFFTISIALGILIIIY
jgi:hypothetical protein